MEVNWGASLAGEISEDIKTFQRTLVKFQKGRAPHIPMMPYMPGLRQRVGYKAAGFQRLDIND